MNFFASLGLLTNSVIFSLAAIMVWLAGSRITDYADEFAKRFRFSRALLGLLLLAGVTSLPEIATSFTAAQNNNAELAVNNLLGSIAMQVAVLALADAIYGRQALTSVVPDSIVMLQGALNIILLSTVAIAISVGDIPLFGAGYWSWALVLASIFSFIKITEASHRSPWVINEEQDKFAEVTTTGEPRYTNQSTTSLLLKTTLAGMAILFAGYLVATSGEVIAEISGLGSSFVGMVFVAIATSLPEASTVFASLQRGLYTMAISDILGTNILNITLIFAVDVIAEGHPVLSQVGLFSTIGAMLGVLVTALFLMGLAERADRTIGRMGTDSALVISVYSLGLVLLYQLRS